MDFYTGKPDRPIEHYGIVFYTFKEISGFQGVAARGLTKVVTNILSGASRDVEQQSDEKAIQVIEQLVLEKNLKANLVYDMKISMVYSPASDGSCIITKIYASYGRYKD